MGEETGISWATSTFNPWRGCTRVSEARRFCYADTMSKRNPAVLGVWGPNGTRVVASEAKWREPLKWDRDAAKAGERRRVFCASLADVFEDWSGPMVDTGGNVLHYNSAATWWVSESTPHGPIPMAFVRKRLFSLVCETPNLDWLLLTKRPENALRMMVEAGLYAAENPTLPCPQPNLWIGTSVENQVAADERIPHLLRVPAAVRFLSCEPLLGPIDFRRVPDFNRIGLDLAGWWIIGGFESGPNARPGHPDWARSLRDQCVRAGVAFHWKQNGEWAPVDDDTPRGTKLTYVHRSGGFTRAASGYEPGDAEMVRIGKKAAGRLLDGRTWDQFPSVASPASVGPALTRSIECLS